MSRRRCAIGVIAFGQFVAVGSAHGLAPDEFPPLAAEQGVVRARGERAPYEGDPPVEPLLSAQYAKLWVKDTVDVVTAPARFDSDAWRKAGYLGLGLVATVAVIDRPARDLVLRNRNNGLNRLLDDVEPFGTGRYTLPVIGGFYAYGLAADDAASRATAQDMLIASFVANGATSIFKSAFGRTRPLRGDGPHHFRPGNNYASFPSGHATHAFAMASVIAHHYEDTWAPYVCYGIAGLVGYARINHDKHWLSDVFAGAMVGHFVGRQIVRFNTGQRNEHGAPTLGAGEEGLTLSWTF